MLKEKLRWWLLTMRVNFQGARSTKCRVVRPDELKIAYALKCL